MLKFVPLCLILIAAFIFSGCPYSANVPLATSDNLEFDARIIGFWKSPYLTAQINGLRIARTAKGQLMATEYSVENGTIKYDKDTLYFTPTRVNDVYFLDQKSDTANLWAAHPYFFSMGGNVISTYSLNDTIIGKTTKFPTTAAYREYVARHIYTPGFLENPDVMMRVTEGELKGAYIDVMVTDSVTMHLRKMAYSVRVSESAIYQKGNSPEKNIRKTERKIKHKTAQLRTDSVYLDEDNGFKIKQFCFTATDPATLNIQKAALKQLKNIAVEPMVHHFDQSPENLSAVLDSRLALMATEMATNELGGYKRVEPVFAVDAYDEREESLREKSLTNAMRISQYLMAPFETIYDIDQLSMDGKDLRYWKNGVYRIWLK
jgi:hypothetical protein